MSTIIQSVSFQNFYCFYGYFKDNTFYFNKGLNIICADNNMGKSKFYNGFLWLLNDKVYDSDTQQLISVKDDAQECYLKMLSAKAKREEHHLEMGIRILFTREDVEYEVTKLVTCQYDSKGWQFHPSTHIMKKKGVNDTPILDEKTQKSIIESLIPIEIQRYALLQGEGIDQLVNFADQKILKETIINLADMRNLVKMTTLAQEIANKASQERKKEDKRIHRNNEKYLELAQQCDKDEIDLKHNKESLTLYQDELEKAKEKAQQLKSCFQTSKERQQINENIKRITNEINKKQKEKEDKERFITSHLFKEDDPWLLYGLEKERKDFDNNRTLWIKRNTQRQIQKNFRTLLPEGSPDTPSLNRMLKDERCEVCGRIAPKDSKAWLHINKLKERACQIDNIASSTSFMESFLSYLQMSTEFANKIPEIKNNSKKIMEEITNLDNEQKEKEEQLEQFTNEQSRLGASSDTDTQIIDDYALALKTIKEKEKQIKEKENVIKFLQDRLSNNNKRIEREKDKNAFNELTALQEELEYIKDLFINTQQRIFDEVVDNLQKETNFFYHKLTKGNTSLAGSLEFDKKGEKSLQIIVKNTATGEPIQGHGTGFQRMKQLALVMAIISSKVEGDKQFDYPFISDAPFSEFSINLIENFLHMAPSVFTQSIILIKDFSDSREKNFITPKGIEIMEKIKNGTTKGSFHVMHANPEISSDQERITKITKYA